MGWRPHALAAGRGSQWWWKQHKSPAADFTDSSPTVFSVTIYGIRASVCEVWDGNQESRGLWLRADGIGHCAGERNGRIRLDGARGGAAISGQGLCRN